MSDQPIGDSTAAEISQKKPYSHVLEAIEQKTKGDLLLTGVAYLTYKRAKREFAKTNNLAPGDSRLSEFHETFQDTLITGFVDGAKVVVDKFENSAKELFIEEEAQFVRESTLLEEVKAYFITESNNIRTVFKEHLSPFKQISYAVISGVFIGILPPLFLIIGSADFRVTIGRALLASSTEPAKPVVLPPAVPKN